MSGFQFGLQFGFQEGVECVEASFTILETITCLKGGVKYLDVRKAFDTV